MITVYHLQHSQSFRIVWLMEVLNVPYELKIFQRDAVTNLAPQAYKDLHPAGTAPVIKDSETGIVLAETNAIVDYILDRYTGKNPLVAELRPAIDAANRVDYLYWFNAGQGSLMPMLLMVYILNNMVQKAPAPVQAVLQGATQKVLEFFPMPRLRALLALMEKQLSETAFFAGDTLTAADIVLSFELFSLNKQNLFAFDKNYPNISAYLKRVQALPSFKTATQKSGDFI